jgi:MFS family permease
LRGLAVGVLAILIGGVGGLVLGAVLGLTSAKSLEKGEAPWRLVVALGGTFGGIGLLLSNGLFQRRYTRRRIGQRYEELATLCGGAAPVWVGLEEAVSFHRFKLVPEDVAFVGFDPAARLVVIEGVRHRYRIRGDDVLSVGQLPGGGSSATAIAYQVGDAQLAIALQSTSVWHELKKQTVGAKRDPLLRRVQETLGHES